MKNETNNSLFKQHGITYREINGVFTPNLELSEQKQKQKKYLQNKQN